jgi:rod shape-determining protein MreD
LTVALEVCRLLTLPFSALGALIAGLLDTTVTPELPAEVNIVFVFAVSAAMLLTVEDGFVWATVGGLTIDILTPGRPLGTTTLAMLLVVGLAIVAGRAIGQRRAPVAVVAVFLLTWLLHAVVLLTLVVVEGVSPGTFEIRLVLISAIINSVIAIPVALVLRAVARRFVEDRADW